MTKQQATTIVKSINKHCKKKNIFQGGKTFGVDFNTWYACHSHLASMFCDAVKVLTGKEGRFLPKAIL